jgi:hypothetical protein
MIFIITGQTLSYNKHVCAETAQHEYSEKCENLNVR